MWYSGYNKFKNVDHINNNINKIFDLQQNKITIFNLRGSIDYSNLTFLHKIMMKILKKKIEKIDKDNLTDENKEFLETYGKKIDFKDKKSITKIIDFVRSEN